jgi:hypothetical protein
MLTIVSEPATVIAPVNSGFVLPAVDDVSVPVVLLGLPHPASPSVPAANAAATPTAMNLRIFTV